MRLRAVPWSCVLVLFASAGAALAEPPPDGTPKKFEEEEGEGESEEAPPQELVSPESLREAVPFFLDHHVQGDLTDDRLIHYLGRLDPEKEVVGLLTIALKTHRDERMRAAAALALGSLAKRQDRQILATALADRAPGVVLAVAAALQKVIGRAALRDIEGLLLHESVAVRCGAADLLRGYRRAVITTLRAYRERASTPEERACALTALYRAGDKPAAAQGVALLESPETRALGVEVLLLDHRVALSALRTALSGDPSEELVAGALLVAEKIGGDGFTLAAKMLPRENQAVRRAALELLLRNADDALVRKLLMTAATKAEPATRARVIDALTTRKDVALLPHARRWVSDDDPTVRAAAARVFAAMPFDQDGAMLLRAYQTERLQATDANLPVRVALLTAMGAIANPDWVPVFVDASGQKGEEQAAVDALVSVGEPAVRTLLLVVKVGDMDRIPFALEGLARIGAGVGDAAEGLFRHPRELVRELGRDLLAASGDPAAVGPLVALFRSETLEDPVPVVEAIATFATPEARAALADAADHPSVAVRVAAVRGLGEGHRRDAETVKILVKVVEVDKTPEVRAEAVMALFRVGAPGLVALLSKLVAYDGGAVRQSSVDVLGWAGNPAAVPQLAARIRDSEGAEAEALMKALERLTRRNDLKSERNFRTWAEQTLAAVKGRAEGAQRAELDVGGAKIRFRSAGAGHTIVALSGAQSGDSFNAALDLLAGAARVVTYDGRGRGGAALGAGLSLESELADLDKLRAALRVERMTLVAHGAAGLIAAEYARRHPARVYKLILVSPPAAGVRHAFVNTAARLLKGTHATDLAELDSRHAWFAPVAWLQYRYMALLPGMVSDPTHAPRVALFPTDPVAHQLIERATEGMRLARVLGAARAPTIVVLGDRAPLTSGEIAALSRVARGNPRVTLQKLPGVGHFPHLENPGLLARAVAGAIGAQN